ncbi:MAG: HYR domain-containing protein, partial [Bacteroidota bacterium]
DSYDGSFEVQSLTGTPPFTFTEIGVTGGSMVSFDGIFPSLGIGTYTVIVQDGAQPVNCFSAFTLDAVVDTVPNIPPVLSGCPADVNTGSDANACGAIITFTPPVASDNCPTGLGAVIQTAGLPSGSLFPLGTTVNTFSVTDAEGAVTTCSFSVTVVDNVNPIAVCQNLTIQLDAIGNASITPAQVNNGSSDACGIASLVLSKTSFNCSNVGANTVTLTVTDVNGNVSTCNATITVQDNVAPIAVCQNLTIQLDATGNASITPAQVNNGSSDACGFSLALSKTSFNCSNVGANTVTLTVTDVNGNVSTCNATITVQDNVAPVAVCQNITVILDATGNVSITPAQIDNGSNDACGVASLVLDKTAFNCSEIGSNTVVLTVTDVNGNSTTCSATVTVVDNIAPVINCNNANISVNNTPGQCGAFVTFNAPTASDICSVVITQISGLPSGSLFPTGTTVNTFRATDPSGNFTDCSFSVTVTDNQNPSITNVPANFSACNPISWTPPTITDNCPGVAITASHLPGTNFPAGTTTVTYTATDVYGNVSSVSFNVTRLEASTAPTSVTSNRDFNNICVGENIQLTVNGGSLGASSGWRWYTGTCGGTLLPAFNGS